MPKKPKVEKAFKQEVDLCRVFISKLPEGWIPYNETAGSDILLVRVADGLQIGVQAKLRLGTEVVKQAMEGSQWYYRTYPDLEGPDYRAILIPDETFNADWRAICRPLGITIIRVFAPGSRVSTGQYGGAGFEPVLPRMTNRNFEQENDEIEWYDLCTVKRHELPEYVPDVAAGAQAPVQLTPWKIKALKIAILIEDTGYVTRTDFKVIGIDHRRWIAMEWLTASMDARTLPGFVPKHLPNFKAQHPKVWEQIRGDITKWRPPRNAIEPRQGALL